MDEVIRLVWMRTDRMHSDDALRVPVLSAGVRSSPPRGPIASPPAASACYVSDILFAAAEVLSFPDLDAAPKPGSLSVALSCDPAGRLPNRMSFEEAFELQHNICISRGATPPKELDVVVRVSAGQTRGRNADKAVRSNTAIGANAALEQPEMLPGGIQPTLCERFESQWQRPNCCRHCGWPRMAHRTQATPPRTPSPHAGRPVPSPAPVANRPQTPPQPRAAAPSQKRSTGTSPPPARLSAAVVAPTPPRTDPTPTLQQAPKSTPLKVGSVCPGGANAATEQYPPQNVATYVFPAAARTEGQAARLETLQRATVTLLEIQLQHLLYTTAVKMRRRHHLMRTRMCLRQSPLAAAVRLPRPQSEWWCRKAICLRRTLSCRSNGKTRPRKKFRHIRIVPCPLRPLRVSPVLGTS